MNGVLHKINKYEEIKSIMKHPIITIIFAIVIFIFAMSTFINVTKAAYISGEGKKSAFTGDFTYDIINDNNAVIIIDITNSSKDIGYLTGIAFMFPNELIVSSFDSTDSDFSQLSYPINAQPFGKDWGLGASTFKSWEGGGNPFYGIVTGDNGIFTFNVFGDVRNYNEQNFINSNNSFAVRFRGYEHGGGDKVIGGDSSSAQVPEPISLVLLGTGLLTYFGYRKKKK